MRNLIKIWPLVIFSLFYCEYSFTQYDVINTFRIEIKQKNEGTGATSIDGQIQHQDINGIDRYIGPGDIVILEPSPTAGDRGYIWFSKFGVANDFDLFFTTYGYYIPITIKVDPSLTSPMVIGPEAHSYQIQFINCKHIILNGGVTSSGVPLLKLDSTNNSSTVDVGLALEEDCDNIAIDGIEICNTSFASIKTAWNWDSATPNSFNTTYDGTTALMKDIVIKNCYIHDTDAEGLYLGLLDYYIDHNTGPGEKYSFNMSNLIVANNRIENTDLDAIQVASVVDRAFIYENEITNYGPQGSSTPVIGIELQEGTTADVYNNFIKDGTSHGIQDLGKHNSNIFNNVIIGAGTTGTVATVSGIIILADPGTAQSMNYIRIYNNTIVGAKDFGVYIETQFLGGIHLFCNNIIIEPLNASNYIYTYDPNNMLSYYSSNNVNMTSAGTNIFVSPTNDDYSLLSTATAFIDVGTSLDGSSSVNYVELHFDKNNNPRPAGSGTDIGAFEYHDTQTISISSGWSYISTYIDLAISDIDFVFEPIVADVNIVQDENGVVYWPQYNLNLIGNMILGEAYQINMINTASLDFKGVTCIPQSTSISIPTGWSYVGYLRTSPASIINLFSTIISTSGEMMKDTDGNLYWPYYSINVIGNMQPGEGYQIKLDVSETFYYPSNTKSINSSIVSNSSPVYYNLNKNTGQNMTIMLPLSCWKSMPNIGDEVGVFDSFDNLIGSSVFSGTNMPITLWGDDEITFSTDGLTLNEEFDIRLWNSLTNECHTLLVKEWKSGNKQYEKDKVSIVKKAQKINEKRLAHDSGNALLIYPNPCYEYLIVDIFVSDTCEVEIKIFDLSGKEILSNSFSNPRNGLNSFHLNTKHLCNGVYTLVVLHGKNIQTEKITILN